MSLIDELKKKRQSLLDERPLQADYITAAQRTLAEMDQTIADLDKAISALTPDDGKGLDAQLGHEPEPIDTGVHNQAEQDAAEAEAVNDALMYGTGIIEIMPDGSRRPVSAEEYYAAAHPDAERTSVVTDHDRVEQTNTDTVAAVEIPEGFIPWSGGECPVPYGRIVDIICRDPDIRVGQTNEVFAHMIDWSNEGDPRYNIIAYKIVEPPAEAERIESDSLTTDHDQVALHDQPALSDEAFNALPKLDDIAVIDAEPPGDKFSAARDGGEAGYWAAARGLTKIEELA